MEKIKLSNFRKIKDSWDLDLAPITFFTGTNNSGKSTVIKSFLVLEDYLKSNNHFELDFNGVNFLKHKIENYKNSINRDNFKKLQKNLIIEYTNQGYEFYLEFEPGEHYLKAQLKELIIIREDSTTLKIYRTAGSNYQLEMEASFLSEIAKNDDQKKKNEEEQLLKNRKEIRVFIKEAKEKIVNSESEIKKMTEDAIDLESKDITNLEPSIKSFYTSNLAELKKIVSESRKDVINLKQSLLDYEKKEKLIDKVLNSNKIKNKKLVYSPMFSLSNFDTSNRRIDKVIRTVLPNYLVDNNLGNKRKKNDFKNSDESLELNKAHLLGDEIISAIVFNLSHLSPHRSSQNKLFIHENRDVDINFLTKNHFEKQLNADLDVQNFMKKWMSEKYFDIGEDYRVITYESTVSKIEILEDKTWINLSDKGFGAGQVFSILLAIASSILENQKKITEKGALFQEDLSIILIEEPEANLHPKLQSLLAELFLEAHYKFGIHFILETHSEYMIRKSQLLNLENPVHFKLYYFGKDGPYEMEYNNDNGTFSREFEEGFFDVGSSLAFDLATKNFD